jgi:hypothetical protein
VGKPEYTPMAANRHAVSIRQQQFISIMHFGTAALALKK